MPKEELLEFEGVVTEILPDARYRVQLDNGHQLVAYTAGSMKKNRIKNSGWGPRDGRGITLRFGKGAIDLPPQKRTHWNVATPTATQSVPAAVIANG